MQSDKFAQQDTTAVRLDKWLWAARFYKTRAIARDMVQSGKVHYNGQRSKPGKSVELGAVVKIPQGFDVKEVEVLQLSDKRVAANIAQHFYRELPSSLEQRQKNALARKAHSFHNPRPDNKPDKKQRRELIKIKHRDTNAGI